MHKLKSFMAWRHGAFVVVIVAALALTSTVSFAQQKATLGVGVATREAMNMYQKTLIPAFEARYPHVTVELEYLGWTVDRYVVRYVSGVAPDVFQVGGDKLGSFLGMVMPLNEFTDDWDVMEDMIPQLVDAARLDGDLYGIPFNYAVRQLTYRKDWFGEAGLDPERPPTTWDELVDMGKQLVRFDGDGNMSRAGYHTADNFTYFSGFLFQAGGSWMSPDMTEATFADEAGMEATRFVHSLFHEHMIADVSETLGKFDEGRTAIGVGTPTYFDAEGGSPNYDVRDIGVGNPLTHNKQAMNVMPSLWLVSDTAEHPEIAWLWLDFLYEIDNLLLQSREMSYVPVRNTLARYAPWSEDPRWHTTMLNLQWGQTVTMLSPYWDLMRRDFQSPTLKKILFEGENPDIMEEVQRQADRWLKEQLGLL